MPTKSNWVSVETIRITPAVMMRMMPASRQEGLSRRNRKAKRRTNAREEDLHMAERGRSVVSSRRAVKAGKRVHRLTVEGERDTSQAEI